jgi:hypothetical protein
LNSCRLSRGESIDLDLFTRSASHLRRILETLGVGRKPRDISPPAPSMLPLDVILSDGSRAMADAAEFYDALLGERPELSITEKAIARRLCADLGRRCQSGIYHHGIDADAAAGTAEAD